MAPTAITVMTKRPPRRSAVRREANHAGGTNLQARKEAPNGASFRGFGSPVQDESIGKHKGLSAISCG